MRNRELIRAETPLGIAHGGLDGFGGLCREQLYNRYEMNIALEEN
jgi:hypothetical protein